MKQSRLTVALTPRSICSHSVEDLYLGHQASPFARKGRAFVGEQLLIAHPALSMYEEADIWESDMTPDIIPNGSSCSHAL